MKNDPFREAVQVVENILRADHQTAPYAARRVVEALAQAGFVMDAPDPEAVSERTDNS